jgi:hypothetical protein
MEKHFFKILTDNGMSPVFIKKLEGYYHRLATPGTKGLNQAEYIEWKTFCERFTNQCLRIMRDESTKMN